jgi:hypothetical protein
MSERENKLSRVNPTVVEKTDCFPTRRDIRTIVVKENVHCSQSYEQNSFLICNVPSVSQGYQFSGVFPIPVWIPEQRILRDPPEWPHSITGLIFKGNDNFSEIIGIDRDSQPWRDILATSDSKTVEFILLGNDWEKFKQSHQKTFGSTTVSVTLTAEVIIVVKVVVVGVFA